MKPINSDELNYLIFRYIHESTFLHSAFVFGYEAGVDKNKSIDPNLVPPQALITLVQKGLRYLEIEANLNNVDEAVDDDFGLLEPMEIITKSVSELREIVKERKKNLQKGKEKVAGEEQEEEKETKRQEIKKNLQKGKSKVAGEEHEEEKETKKHKPAIKRAKPPLGPKFK